MRRWWNSNSEYPTAKGIKSISSLDRWFCDYCELKIASYAIPIPIQWCEAEKKIIFIQSKFNVSFPFDSNLFHIDGQERQIISINDEFSIHFCNANFLRRMNECNTKDWSVHHSNLCIWQFHWRKWQTRRNNHDHKMRNPIQRNASSRQNHHKFKWRFFFNFHGRCVERWQQQKFNLFFLFWIVFIKCFAAICFFFLPHAKSHPHHSYMLVRSACMELTRAGHNNKNNNSWKYNNNKRKMMTECRQ